MKKRGLTLLEVLISALILALVATGIINVFVSGKRHIAHTRFRIQAAQLLKYQLNQLHMQVRQDQWGSNCLSNQAFCPGSMNFDNITWTLNWTTEGGPVANLRRVKLNINWTEPAP